ncbi:MAG: hypothetical protein A4E58_01204 [Syntrophorhabdus sp. PtaB.Bin006]|nr:MAG: hypothetical protein A4E58_01204 [Syntrophorhabdus sp. PtaB.Bin006]
MTATLEKHLEILRGRISLWLLRLRFLRRRLLSPNDTCTFRCNICGNWCTSPLSEVKGRESRSCYHCGSNRRFRTIILALSEQLFNKVDILPHFKESKSIVGIGMSDTKIYARPLRNKFSYTNTYYHKEPKLDVMAISEDMYDTADFVISTDVFEHVPLPVGAAFSNLYKILKVGGVCIFSVPYRMEGVTIEHFPELFRYKLIERKGAVVLANTTRDGRDQLFDNLRFHGGGGATLEMRVFSKSSLLSEIKKAGFREVKLYDECIPEYGVMIEDATPSLVISMRKTADPSFPPEEGMDGGNGQGSIEETQ